MSSRFFEGAGERPKKPHLVQGPGGVAGEVGDLRRDVEAGFNRVQDELDAAGGGGGVSTFDRTDMSVNYSTVDGANSLTPVMKTRTGTNAAGGFNGAGVGSKAILGYRGYDLLPLGDLLEIEYTWRNLSPENDGGVPEDLYPFINFVVDINGDDSVLKIFVLTQTVSASKAAGGGLDGNFVVTEHIAGIRYTYNWQPTVNTVMVVNLIPPVVPVVNLGPGWLDQAFAIADILAAFPAARLRDAASGDGGMPAGMVTPAMMLVSGDSANVVTSSKMIENLDVNGTSI